MLRTPMPRLIDISVPLARGIPTWPGSTGFHVDQTLSFEKGDGITVSRIDMDVHTGTHVESALHYVEGGDTIETVPLEAFVGPATVIDLRAADAIGPAELDAAGIADGTERLLLRTRNSGRLQIGEEFRRDFVGLTVDGARWIASRAFRLVGTDYLSVQRFDDEPETHRVLDACQRRNPRGARPQCGRPRRVPPDLSPPQAACDGGRPGSRHPGTAWIANPQVVLALGGGSFGDRGLHADHQVGHVVDEEARQ